MAQYPTAASTDANLYVAVNSKATVLAGALTSVGGNNGADIEVTDTTGFPSTGFITIDQEAISYTGIIAGPPRFTGITRGADGTTATAHSSGATVKHNVIAAHHNAPKDEIIALETHLIPGQHTGTATNDNAAAGKVGERVTSAVGATSFPATGTYGDLTSISLTAGDWDVSAVGQWGIGSMVVTGVIFGISTTAGNSATGLTQGDTSVSLAPTATANADTGFAIPIVRMSLTATTTIYFKFRADFSSGTGDARGRLTARRVR